MFFIFVKNIRVMKAKALIGIFVLSMGLSMTSCVVVRHDHKHPKKEVPPGHAKKRHGKKSAKYYAPGHVKKR